MTGETRLLDRLAAVVEEAVIAAWRRRQVTLLAVVVIAVMLAGPGLAAVVLARVAAGLGELSETARVRAFLEVGLGSAGAAAVRDAAASLPGAGTTVLVTEEEARAALLARHPELRAVVLELPPEDLALPASVEADVPGGDEAAAVVADALARLPGVTEVRRDAGLGEELRRIRARLRGAAVLAGALVLALAAFGVGSVVRMGALSRREELGILRLVGAPRLHVRAPLVLEGLGQGALGGVLAAILVDALTRVLAPALAGAAPGFVPGIGLRAALVLVAGSAVAGLVAAAIAAEHVLRRHARLER